MAEIREPLCRNEAAMDEKYGYPYSNSPKEEEQVQRTGSLWTAVAHIITSVIGAGVLSLAWSLAQLGWIAGPAIMIVFALITLYSASLIVDCYRFPDAITGPIRNVSYRDAVRVNLGEKKARICALVQYVYFYGICVAYTITASLSIRAIRQSNCYHRNGHESPCQYSKQTYIIYYGVIQVFLSQLPNFHNLWGLSIVAAMMSFSYATVGFGLGVAKVIENGEIYGNLGGISSSTSITGAQKAWRILQALGDTAFAFPYSSLVLEIQDTLKSPPPENGTMKKASLFSIMITTTFYMLCGFMGYAAFGENAPGNLLTGFGFYEPYWLIDFANACIVVHLVGAYQVFCQPIFAFVEGWASHKWPNNKFINEEFLIRIPLFGVYSINLLRLCWRTAFVVSTTVISILFPLFNDVLAILGALNFWPLIVYFPVEMYISQNNIRPWALKWTLLQAFSFISFLVSVACSVGAIEGLVNDTDT